MTRFFLLAYFLFSLPLCAQPGKKPADALSSQEAYLTARRKLQRQDSLMAFDASLVLSPFEQQANGKLVALRDSLLQVYQQQHFNPVARYFYQSQSHLYTTRLYEVLRQMPKGGVLHLHAPAAGNFHWIVDRALTEPHCHVFWDEASAGFVKGQLAFFAAGKAPNGFYPAASLAERHPDFAGQLYAELTLSAQTGRDSAHVWGQFENIFRKLNGFVRYQPVFRDYMRHVLERLLADGVQHVAFREGLAGGLYDLVHPEGHYSPDTLVRYWQELQAEVQQQDPAFSLHLIYANIRSRSNEVIAQDLEKAFGLKKRFPDLIQGYDLVAEEDAGNSTLYFLDTWLSMDSLSKVYGVQLPLCMHGGESNQHHIDNLYDLVLLRSKRIGHGINLFRFPSLIPLVRSQQMVLEVCPLSNQLLGYVPDLRNHPAVFYMKQGVQVTLSSDDPGVFGYEGVTPDYWAACLAWGLDLRSLKKLALNGLLFSSLSGRDRVMALRNFETRWEAWVRYVNNTL
jgi:adenosine deaminase CECR1